MFSLHDWQCQPTNFCNCCNMLDSFLNKGHQSFARVLHICYASAVTAAIYICWPGLVMSN